MSIKKTILRNYKDLKDFNDDLFNKPKDINVDDLKGVVLDSDPYSKNYDEFIKGKFSNINKFNLSNSKKFEKSEDELNLFSQNYSPYSTRDIYKIFNDTSTDYFKHGIFIERQSLNNKTGLSNYSTPEENNDPVIFGFDLVIDVEKSPLLNGSINDFLDQFSTIEEINSKKTVYNDFIIQFIKLFKTQSGVNINVENSFLMNGTGNDNINTIANSNEKNSISFGKKAYMSYYLQKVDGLKELSESNGVGGYFKYLTDYRKDKITLHFLEDVSLTMGTLASLYKLLYWSKPNGKSLIPENLLRFDCKIIVSELRNFNRIKASNDRVDVIKDNLSRYVYSLNECQFFFDTRPHEDSINVGGSNAEYKDYSVSFDYKFSSVVYEKWNPSISQYRSYNDSSMWDSNGNQIGVFNDIGTTLKWIGYDKDFLIKNYTKVPEEKKEDLPTPPDLEKAKNWLQKRANKLARDIMKTTINEARSQLNLAYNRSIALVNRSISKILNNIAGTNGIKPPLNVYTDKINGLGRTNDALFYDISGQLSDFAGDSLSALLSSGKKSIKNKL